MISRESYVHLIRQVDDLVAIFEHHPDPATREQAVALLSGLDALHREGLNRLVRVIREAGDEALVEEAAADPVVEILLGLYDVVELNLPEEPASEPTRPQGFVAQDELSVLQEEDLPDRYAPANDE